MSTFASAESHTHVGECTLVRSISIGIELRVLGRKHERNKIESRIGDSE